MIVELIRPKSGKPFRQINHDGQCYLVAPKKGRYHIKLHNNCAARKLAVVSVDGLSVLDGEKASTHGDGYVLDGWETLIIKGWRRTDEEVAEFNFTEKDESYSAQAGKGTKNTSVVGVTVFDERCEFKIRPITEIHHYHSPWSPYVSDQYRSVTVEHVPQSITLTSAVEGDEPVINQCYLSTNTPSPRGTTPRRRLKGSMDAGLLRSAAVDLGTGYGKRAEMRVEYVSFNRASATPSVVISIRYAMKARLKEWGVPVDAKSVDVPQPFPAERVACEPPPGWGG